MKKTLILLLVIGLIAGSMVGMADAKKKKKRIERSAKGTYQAPALILVGTCASADAIGCVALITGNGENYLTKASVTDQTGQPVYVSIQGDANGDNQDDTNYGTFCGELEEPITIEAGTELHFWVGATPDPGFAGCQPGVATTGSVDVTFSNRP